MPGCLQGISHCSLFCKKFSMTISFYNILLQCNSCRAIFTVGTSGYASTFKGSAAHPWSPINHDRRIVASAGWLMSREEGASG